MAKYLVVGASSGIGNALVNQLSQQGHLVYATYFKNEIIAPNANTSFHQLNVLEENISLEFLPESINGIVY